jgi:pantoate--beta-alanine ligase
LRVTRGTVETARWCERYRAAGLSVGFAPTMGALHAGHVSLFARARRECDRAVASIFVNPTQFGPGEDLSRYPRPLEADLEACRQAGCDLVFVGEAADVYPPGYETWVEVEDLARPLCGRSRPGHFRGVATVVAKLLAIVRPHRAYFGQKDFQQARVIERLARDLDLGVEIRICETVREPDGLAMSSRNRYLDAAGRRAAARIPRGLRAAGRLVAGGETSVARVLAELTRELAPDPDLEIEYAEARDAESLAEFPAATLPRPPRRILLAVAARVRGTRLIDNLLIPPLDAEHSPARGAEEPRG